VVGRRCGKITPSSDRVLLCCRAQVAYGAVLDACRRAARGDEAQRVFDMMLGDGLEVRLGTNIYDVVIHVSTV
jgi:pentatricopeptide repeat protein